MTCWYASFKVPFDHTLHQLVVPRFPSPGCRRGKVRTGSLRARLPALHPPLRLPYQVLLIRFGIIRPTCGVIVRPFGVPTYYRLC